MKHPPFQSHRRHAGMTRRQVVVLVVLVVVVAMILIPVYKRRMREVNMANQLSAGRQIYFPLRAYALESGTEGRSPAEVGTGADRHLATTSNELLERLMPRYVESKQVFFNKRSAYCRTVAQTEATKYQVLPGECDWAYVRDADMLAMTPEPLLTTAFAPGTTTYVEDRTQKGGVWGGTDAVVIWAMGAAEVRKTQKRGAGYYVPRPDKPEANAFEQAGDWLAGEKVKVLNPKEF